MNDIPNSYLTKLVFLSTIPDWKKISSCNKLLYFIPFESDIWIYPCVEQAITFTDGDNYLPITKYDGTIWIGHEQSSISTLQISLKFQCLTLFFILSLLFHFSFITFFNYFHYYLFVSFRWTCSGYDTVKVAVLILFIYFKFFFIITFIFITLYFILRRTF